MTASVQTSVFSSNNEFCFYSHSRRHSRLSKNSYQATVTDFDGDEYDYDVEADSYEEAAAMIEAMAADGNIQVYNMNIYLVA